MLATTKTRSALRGLTGVLAMGVGLYLALTFKESSPWPAHLQALMMAVAYTAAIGGVALFSSYYQQASFKQMRSMLVPMAVVLGTFLLIQLSKLL